MSALRTPLSPLRAIDPALNSAANTTSAPASDLKQKMYASLEDKKLMEATSCDISVMQQLGAPPKFARFSTGAGAAALRALGYGHDGAGNATYDPAVGYITCQLLRLNAERQLFLAEQQRLTTLLQAQQHQLAKLNAEQGLLLDEQKQNQQLRQQLAQAQQELERREEMYVAQHADERADEAPPAGAALLGAALVAEAEQKADEAEVQRAKEVAAAQKIKEKYRGRSRRARAALKHLRESLPVEAEWSSVFKKLLKGKQPPEQAHLRELWECQIRCLNSKKHRCRWHPEILAWCADVWRTDRRAYEQMAFGNVLILPHPDTVRKHCSSGIARPGHNTEAYKALGREGATKGWKGGEREVFLKMDEIDIKTGGLMWRKVMLSARVLSQNIFLYSPLTLSQNYLHTGQGQLRILWPRAARAHDPNLPAQVGCRRVGEERRHTRQREFGYPCPRLPNHLDGPRR